MQPELNKRHTNPATKKYSRRTALLFGLALADLAFLPLGQVQAASELPAYNGQAVSNDDGNNGDPPPTPTPTVDPAKTNADDRPLQPVNQNLPQDGQTGDDDQQKKEQEEKERQEKERKEQVHKRAQAYNLQWGEPTAAAIDNWLARFGSPQVAEAPPGKTIGQVYLEMGWKYGINPAYAVAFFTKESSCGTAGDNLAARNFGNIRWSAGYHTLDKVWRAYDNWTTGMEAWFALIRQEYLNPGARTLDDILPSYAPPTENDTELYMTQVMDWVDTLMVYGTYNTNLVNRQYFQVTGYYVANRFLAYWREHGGVDNFGWPVSQQMFENGQVVQYFERAVLEYWPQNPPAYQILLRTLGTAAAKTQPPVAADAAPDEGAVFYPVTGHWLSGQFTKFWQEHGGLAQFGYPIAEAEVIDNKLIQWCERARFEFDFAQPEKGVMLGLVGREAAVQNGYLSY